MRKLRIAILAVAVLLALLCGRSCYHPEREYSATNEEAAEFKEKIEDSIGLTIVAAERNVGNTGMVSLAKVIRSFFHDRFVPIEGYWDRNTNVFNYTSTATECDSGQKKCYGFLVFPITLTNGAPVFAIWYKEVLTVHPEIDFTDPYTPYRMLQEVYYAWGEDTHRFVMPPPSMPKRDTLMPWETQSRAFMSELLNAATDGRYRTLINKTAQRVIDEDITYVEPSAVVFVDMPEELFEIARNGSQTPLSKASRDRVLELATIDVNRVLIMIAEHDATEQHLQLATLISNFAYESHTHDAATLWRKVVNRE